VRGFTSIEELEGTHPTYRLCAKTSLQQMIDCGEVVSSSTDANGSLFDYTLSSDQHIERSGLLGEAYLVVSLGSPGAIHPLVRKPMDLAAVYVKLSGKARVFEIFSYNNTTSLEDEVIMSSIRPGPPGCRSILHHRKLYVILGEAAQQYMHCSTVRVILRPGEVLVTLPGTSVQAYDVGYNAVTTHCLAISYWLSFHICLDQVSMLL
jgi:hypothetical protein